MLTGVSKIPSEVTASDQTNAPAGQGRLHFTFLDGLRGLAALYVVLFHIRQAAIAFPQRGSMPHWFRFTSVFGHGHFAVDVFIVLSGFCLMLPILQSSPTRPNQGFRAYILRRARRILPAYYAALALSLTILFLVPELRATYMTDMPHSLEVILSHLVLLHNFNANWIYQINGPMWSVATEWQIYFAFPLLLLPLWRRFGPAAAIGVGFLLGLSTFRLHLSEAHFWYLGLFAMGMTAASLGLSKENSKRIFLGLGLLIVALSAIILKLHLRGSGEAQPLNDLWIGAVAACLLTYCTRGLQQSATSFSSVLTRVLSLRVPVLLGTFSYSLYLIHMPLLGLCIAWSHAHSYTTASNLQFLFGLALPLILGASYLFYLAFERPFLRSRAQKTAFTFVSMPTGGVKQD